MITNTQENETSVFISECVVMLLWVENNEAELHISCFGIMAYFKRVENNDYPYRKESRFWQVLNAPPL